MPTPLLTSMPSSAAREAVATGRLDAWAVRGASLPAATYGIGSGWGGTTAAAAGTAAAAVVDAEGSERNSYTFGASWTSALSLERETMISYAGRAEATD